MLTMANIRLTVLCCICTLSFQSNLDQIEQSSGCPENRFGLRCQYECHCPSGDGCNPVNGLCHSGVCHQFWTGAGCQIRHPVMKDPPNVKSQPDNCSFAISWPAWSTEKDIGDGPVVAYLLQVKNDTKQWTDVSVYDANNSTHYSTGYEPPNGSQHVVRLFRLTLFRGDDGKMVKSVPGPESEAAVLHCSPSAERSTTAQQKWHERSTAEVKEMNELTDSWVTDQSHNQWTITELWTTEQTSSATPRTKVINEIPVSWVKGQSRLGQPALLEFTEHRKIKLALNAGALEATNGSLKITLTPLQSFNDSRAVLSKLIAITDRPSLDLGKPSLGTYYKISISAADVAGDQEPVEGYFWTPPLVPPSPKPPSIINVTTNSVTIVVHVLGRGQLRRHSPISSYHVIVEEVNDEARSERHGLPSKIVRSRDDVMARKRSPNEEALRKKRVSTTSGHDQFSLPVADEAARFFHTAVELPGNLTDDVIVTVGDGKTYGGYRNAPLKPNTRYNVWLAVSSRLDDVTARTYVVAPDTVRTLESATWPATGPLAVATAGGSVGVVGVIFGLLVLIVIGVLVTVCLLWKRRSCAVNGAGSWPVRAPHRHVNVSPPPAAAAPSFESTIGNGALERKYVSAEALEGIGHVSLHGAMTSTKRRASASNASDVDGNVGGNLNNWIHLGELSRYLDVDETIEAALRAEFRRIPKAFLHPATVALSAENAPLNRSPEVVPYDWNRVTLDDGEYVNASVVRCYDDDEVTYVVTQTPMSIGVGAFWRLVWQRNVDGIVMLMNVREPNKPECVQYWPDDEGDDSSYGQLSFRIAKTEATAHYVIRDVRIRNGDGAADDRVVRHFQFTSWSPDGVPQHPVAFAEFVRRIGDECAPCRESVGTAPTVLVHCHAGGGRSGTYVAVDSIQRRARRLGGVDVLGCVAKLRRQRPSQVRTFGQYRFTYACLAELFDHPTSRIAAEHLHVAYAVLMSDGAPSRNRTMLDVEYEKLRRRRDRRHCRRRTRGDWSLLSSCSEIGRGAEEPRSIGTSRRSLPLPVPRGKDQDKKSASALLAAPFPDPCSGPRFLDSYRRRAAFVVSDYPADPDDFWSFVVRNDVRLLIDVSGCPSVSPLPSYFPVLDTPFLDGRFRLSVTEHGTEPSTGVSLTELVIVPDRSGGGRSVSFGLVRWKAWSDGLVLPSVRQFVDFVQTVRARYATRCPDGGLALILGSHVGRAALLSLAWSLCQRLDSEWLVDVYTDTKYVQDSVPWVVSSLEHYKFLYRFIKEQILRVQQLGPPNQRDKSTAYRGTSVQ